MKLRSVLSKCATRTGQSVRGEEGGVNGGRDAPVAMCVTLSVRCMEFIKFLLN